ncbi:hypothetical protein D0504_10675 [Weissella confusa]|uniref:hypothetical protein n=1 Tax=Weissella confusa TaxID=1583 RepID=UPI0021C22465|nr:hypothetical protein [Weissella confusa]MCT8394155.1 hypothetical protein [Weissella confusa]
MKILAYIVGGIVVLGILIATAEVWLPIAIFVGMIWLLWFLKKDDIKKNGLKSTVEGAAMKAQNQAMQNQADKMNSAMNKMDDEI